MFRRTYNWAKSRRAALAVFAAMGGLYFFTNFQRLGVPGPIFNELQREFGPSATAVTGLGAAFLYVYAAMQFFVGAGADRFGPARMVLTGGALLTLGSLFFPLSSTLPQVYACRVVLGLGASFMYISIIKQIVLTFEPRHFPPLLGALLVMGYSGGVVATIGLPLVVDGGNWRTPFTVAGVACAAVFVLVVVLVAGTGGARGQGSSFRKESVMAVLRRRQIYPILAAGSINFGIYYVLQMIFGKKFLEDFLGMSSRAAGLVTGAMLVTVTVGYMAGGFLPKLAGERRRPFVIIASAGTLAAAVLLVAGMVAKMPGWWFAAAYVLLGATNSPGIVGTSLLKEVSPPSAAAFSISLLNAASYVAVAIASTVVGLVLDAYKPGAREVGGHMIYPPAAYTVIFIGMVVLACCTTAISFLAPETRGVQTAE